MDCAASTKHDVLERMMVDESVKPTDLPLSLLEYITNGFSDDEQIGKGGFAVVYKGMLRNGTIAVKKLLNTHLHEEKFHKEVECLMKAKHKNVVRFLGYCSDTQGKMESYNGKLVMAEVPQRLLCFEYLPKGNLHEYITDAFRELKWRQCYQIIKGICTGLHYLHENRIVHLDLKPANILLDNNMVPKIADFGLSRCFDEKQSHVITSKLFGSLGYLAPEVYCGRITFKSDIYSLGVIMIEILTREKMYPEDYDVLKNWGNNLETSHREKQLEQLHLCAEIGKECTEYDPSRRPDAQTIIRRLHEADIADISTVSDMSKLSITQEEQHGDGHLKYWIYFLCDFAKLNAYDPDRQRWIHVPKIRNKVFPKYGYNESMAVGRDLLVFFKGKSVEHIQFLQMRYFIRSNSWSLSPRMNCSRSLFGSASVGHKAYLAGGIDCYGTLLSSAETYDCLQKRFAPLPSMNRARMRCSGVCMDGNLYAIGGKGSDNEELTCGEEYDFELGSWRVIEKMTEGLNVRVKSFTPPLVAVVNNELFGADYIENKVKKYDKKNNRWITLGRGPESMTNGSDIGFKACGDKLIFIVGPSSSIHGMLELNSWVPDGRPSAWNLIASKRSTRGFMYHAAAMSIVAESSTE